MWLTNTDVVPTMTEPSREVSAPVPIADDAVHRQQRRQIVGIEPCRGDQFGS